ncbi:MAG: polysaccharide biosynthesis tyrosine autokinase [Chloroflexi bacterium]|nr:MAG: polysaccharide biosynthesis tyrosine autokinase [Chloroflexota bacterium]
MELITVALAMAVGLSLSGSVAYVLEYMDGAIKSQDEIEVLLNTPVVGNIFEVKQGKNKQPFSIADNPRHPVTEAFRNLRTFIEFTNRDKLHTILVTSAGSNDGKTWIAANLAISMAREGKRVVLIDADLRNPSLHQFFHEERENGLTDLFQGKQAVTDVLKYNNKERVGLITAGELPQNTYELMNIKMMERILMELMDAVDTVIIDSPPFFIADSVLLSSLVDSVLAVVRPNHTLKQSALAMIEQIHRSGGNLTGVVINRIPFRQLKYYLKYPYNSLEKYHLASERMQKEPR